MSIPQQINREDKAELSKFQFDRRFDKGGASNIRGKSAKDAADAIAAKHAAEQQAKADATAAAEDALRQAGYAKGYADGEQAGGIAARQGTEARQSALLECVQTQLQTILDNQDQLVKTLDTSAVQLASSIAKKLFPTWYAAAGKEETTRVLQEIFGQVEHEKRLILKTHPSELQPLEDLSRTLLQEFAIEADLVVRGDDLLQPGDIKIRWAGGGAERRPQHLLTIIDQLSKEATS